jgi:hypothetical protein
MLKNVPPAGVCVRAAAERSFRRTERFTSQERIQQGRFHCGRVKDVVMKRLASGARRLEKRNTDEQRTENTEPCLCSYCFGFSRAGRVERAHLGRLFHNRHDVHRRSEPSDGAAVCYQPAALSQVSRSFARSLHEESDPSASRWRLGPDRIATPAVARRQRPCGSPGRQGYCRAPW